MYIRTNDSAECAELRQPLNMLYARLHARARLHLVIIIQLKRIHLPNGIHHATVRPEA